MKTLLVLFVACLLILASLQADAKRLIIEERSKLMMDKRQLLISDTKSSRKIDVGANNNSSARDAVSNNGTATSETKTGSDSNKDADDDGDDDANQSYGRYGNSNGSTAESHHYFTNDQKPIKD